MSDPLEEMFSLPTSGKDFDLPAARLATALLRSEVQRQKADIAKLRQDLEDDYALKTQLDALSERVKLPITMVYSTAALILVTVIGALVALVVRGHGP